MSVFRGKQDVLGLYLLIAVAGYQQQTQRDGDLTRQGLFSHIKRYSRLDNCGAHSPDQECQGRALCNSPHRFLVFPNGLLNFSHLSVRESMSEIPAVGGE